MEFVWFFKSLFVRLFPNYSGRFGIENGDACAVMYNLIDNLYDTIRRYRDWNGARIHDVCTEPSDQRYPSSND